MTSKSTPTLEQYQSLDKAYSFFNKKLFGSKLPNCLIVFEQKGSKTLGYYASGRWGQRKGKAGIDEIALNPFFLRARTDRDILSTLVHEMAHCWQQHFGKPSRSAYHNKEWAGQMEVIGLMPSNTGLEGGKKTGQQMTHYIIAGGQFDKACAELIKSGVSVSWVRQTEVKAETSANKNKVAYECLCGVKAWAKPDVKLICGECELPMEAQD